MLIGVSGYHEALRRKVDFFEVETSFESSSAKLSCSLHLTANHYFYRMKSEIPLKERVELLKEAHDRILPEQVSLKLTPSFFNLNTLESSIYPFQALWRKLSPTPLLIDLPSVIPRHLNTSPLLVTDPLWHCFKKSSHWKVHGWNDSRWVRRYPESDLQRLAKASIKQKPKTLVFGHSQRAEQVLEFLKILREMKAK